MSVRDYLDRLTGTGRADTDAGAPGDGAAGTDLGIVVGLMLAVYVVFVAIGVVLGYDTNGIVNALSQVTFLTAVYALVVLALNLHWGYTGLFNIGVAGFMAVGTYTMAMATAAPDARVPGLGLPIWAGIALGMAAAAVIGLVAALPALRLRADYLAIVTIALAEIIRLTYLSSAVQTFTVFGTQLGTGGGSGIGIEADPDTVVVEFLASVPGLNVLFDAFGSVLSGMGVQQSVINNWYYAFVLLVVVVAYYWLLQRIGHSPFGRVLKSIREDEDVARALGKNTRLFKIKSFMVGCSLMGLAGILWFGSYGFINPNTFLPQVTFFVWIALIIGGAGSNTGGVVGAAMFAAVLFELPRYLASIAGDTGGLPSAPPTFARAVGALFDLEPLAFVAYGIDNIGPLRLVLVGVVLIVLMQRRPEGLLGHRKETAASIGLSRPNRSRETTDATAATDGGEEQ
ncbi:branched-chain amino acid ABC transporter permease [Halobium salinum]|uniref:Branched-chain amino acid ABC transporter permease n=1 Tax=Halobium salinum TaxID=1364940 RepID=A0ABD5PF23_9EURY|nr:branched-chain amino acid ABC transporter permease [Halobium salinum]